MHHSGVKYGAGKAIFRNDVPALAGELFQAVVTSARAHAKIT